MDVDTINAAADRALEANKRAEYLIVCFAGALFGLGVLAAFLAYLLKNPYFFAGSLVLNTLLLLPILEIRKLRRENVALQTFPALIYPLPPSEAARQIVETLQYLRG